MQEEKRLQVISLARQVRDWAEQRDDLLEYPTGDLMGWCAIASAQLSRLFKKNDIDHTINLWEDEGECHVFLMVDDYVVDVTATQYTQLEHERVVFMHISDAKAYEFYNTSVVFDDAKKLRMHQKKTGWPSYQTAYASYVKM